MSEPAPASRKVRPSWAALPMFFDASHRALGEECDEITDGDVALHDPPRVIPRLGALGLLQLLVPANQGGGAWGAGGAAVDVRALCVAREALAYSSGLADSIFAVQGLGSHPILLAGEGARRASVLAEVVRGERVSAFALTEPEAGSDVASMRTTARREGDAWILDGEKVFISNVGIAHHYVVFANADPSAGKKGISAFLVEASSEGLLTEPIAMSVEHPLGRLAMKSCRVPASALLGEVGMGLRLALGTLDVFRTSVGAAAVGMARRAVDESIARVTRRVQFGKPLSDFQLTQAALADMATELDAARLLVCRAAWEKDQPRDDSARGRGDGVSVAMAKMYATEAAQRIIDRGVQLFGGLGVTEGNVLDRLYREIRPLRIYEGTTEIQKLIIGGALTARPG
ncbi:MAG: acyl-CoA dehydrogenase family protein [Labilithrix sp.]|nr:acyl-CoA dehydrogenase family protein [Labilithrix sp.]MCW5832720.1 acyl-CoA dehydrogenase family protein [Labilithrix sp.]